MRTMRIRDAAAALTMALSLALPTTASAVQLSGELKPPKGAPEDTFVSCAHASADVLRWTPAAGPLASYVADAYLANENVFIVIGYDARGFWSAEADPGTDACGCSKLYLRHTSFSGERLGSHALGQGSESDPEQDQARRRDAIKQRIFTVAAGPLDVAALRQDLTLGLPKHDAEGNIEKFTGWFAELKKKDGALVRFAIVSTPFMCWCDSSWKAYTLAAPKKSTSTSGRTK
jgi:hypothetical protein